MRLQNLIKRMMPVVMAVMAVLLAACGQTAASPTPTRPTPTSTPTKASTPLPTPTPTQQPIPTVPVSQASPLQQELAREFGEWGLLVKAPADGMLLGMGGNVSFNKGDAIDIYRTADGLYLVSNGVQSGLVKPEDVESVFGQAIKDAPSLKASDLKARIQHAKAWATYREHWQAPQYIDGLVDQNGKPVDLQRFFTDRDYAVKIVQYYLQSPQIRHDGKIIPLRRRTSKDPNKIVDALYAIYYGMRFDPDITMFGQFGANFWYKPPELKVDGHGWYVGTPSVIVVPPYVDDAGVIHSNNDLKPTSANPSSTIVYNSFTQPVKVKEVWFWYDRSIGSLRQAYESGRLNASVHVMVTPPGGKPVEFYFAHLDGSKGSLLDNLLKSNGFNPLNAEYISHPLGANLHILHVNGRMSLEPGKEFATLDKPSNDPWSEGWHIEFGTQYYSGIEDYRIATIATDAILHPYASQHFAQFRPHLPPAPSEQGYWMGKKHVVSYQPTVPAVAVRQSDGTVAFASISPYKKEPGWKSQLPKSARFSRHPKSYFRRRA